MPRPFYLGFAGGRIEAAGYASAEPNSDAVPGGIDDPDLKRFGMVGFVFGQTIRLNIADTRTAHVNPLIGTTATSPAAPSCAVTFVFFDMTGAILKQATVTLAAGQATFLDLKHFEVRDTILRAQVAARCWFRAVHVGRSFSRRWKSSTTFRARPRC